MPSKPPLAVLPADGAALTPWRRGWPLVLILVAVLCSLLPGLGKRDVARVMENVSIGSSQETWHALDAARRGAYPDDLAQPSWLLPVWAGMPRLNKPPMLVWVNIAFAELTGHDPATTDAARFILLCRLVAVGFALLAVASVYWIGLTLGDRRLAVLAAVVFATLWCVPKAARTASYDTHLLGYATFAVAAALAALRPFGAKGFDRQDAKTPRRQEEAAKNTSVSHADDTLQRSRMSDSNPSPASSVSDLGVLASWRLGGSRLGVLSLWFIAALATAAATMTKGPLALVVVVVPLLVMGVAIPRRRTPALLGCALIVAVAGGCFAAWFFAMQRHIPTLGSTLATEYSAQREEQQPWWYYGPQLLIMTAPWLGYLVAGLFHPFVNAEGRARRVRLLPLLWLAALVLFFSIPGAKQQRYVLPAMPAAALLIALLLRDHGHLAKLGIPDPGAWILQRPLGALAVVASVALPVLLAAQPWLMERGYLGDPRLATIGTGSAVWLGLLLLVLALMAERWLRTHSPFKGAVTLGVWMLVVLGVLEWAYAARSHADDRAPAVAAALTQAAADTSAPQDAARLVYYIPSAATQPAFDDEEPLLIHLRHAVPSWGASRIAARKPAVVVSEPTEAARSELGALGYERAFDFKGDKETPRRAFVRSQVNP